MVMWRLLKAGKSSMCLEVNSHIPETPPALERAYPENTPVRRVHGADDEEVPRKPVFFCKHLPLDVLPVFSDMCLATSSGNVISY